MPASCGPGGASPPPPTVRAPYAVGAARLAFFRSLLRSHLLQAAHKGHPPRNGHSCLAPHSARPPPPLYRHSCPRPLIAYAAATPTSFLCLFSLECSTQVGRGFRPFCPLMVPKLLEERLGHSRCSASTSMSRQELGKV